MNGLEWTTVALIALAALFPAGVAFGIQIGKMREQDRKADK